MGPRVPLTIVIGTIQGWPEIRSNVASFRAAAEAVGGELIVADGSGRPAPHPGETGPRETWLSEPGLSVFQLRRLAYQRAQGEIVAITEDHCLVADDWGRRMLQAHAEHPEASVIGGAVENAATDSLLDWAPSSWSRPPSCRRSGAGPRGAWRAPSTSRTSAAP